MVAWVQRRDSAMLVTAAALLRTEVGDEAGTMGRLGQADREDKWTGWWCRFGMAGKGGFSPQEERGQRGRLGQRMSGP
jgi:hypothetical protein